MHWFSVIRSRAPMVGAFMVLAAVADTAPAATVLPDFDAATFISGAVIDNPYFPLVKDNLVRVFEAEDERFELSNIGSGPLILGVQTFTQLDRAFENDLLVEETFDYYAQDNGGNVWYFGEDVTNYIYDDFGNLIDTNSESAWRAGVNDALPGFIMPAELTVGFNYFQEFAPNDDALDQGTIFATGLTVSTIFGSLDDVVQILETTELDPDAREFKYYAPGFGLILAEEGLDEQFQNPDTVFMLTRVSVIPEPSAWATLIFGFGIIGLALRRQSRHGAPGVSYALQHEAPLRVLI